MKLSLQQALSVLDTLCYTPQIETIGTFESFGRISASEIVCKEALCKFDNSAMDGYAFNTNSKADTLQVIGTSLAGSDQHYSIKDNEALKVMTGSPIPNGANAVIAFEDARFEASGDLIFPKDSCEGDFIRHKGSDIQSGEIIIKQQERINHGHIGLFFSQGLQSIEVFCKPKIALFSTGNELADLKSTPHHHQIYNTNTPSLAARVQELGGQIISMETICDDKHTIKKHIQTLALADLIITTGGLNSGDADFTKEVFDTLGMKLLFENVNIKPAKPTRFGLLQKSFVLNLPGNPLSALLGFEVFGRVILHKLLGKENISLPCITAKLAEDFEHKRGKTSIIPGFFDGEFFHIAPRFCSSMLSVLHRCNAVIVFDQNTQYLKANASVKIVPFSYQHLHQGENYCINYPPVS